MSTSRRGRDLRESIFSGLGAKGFVCLVVGLLLLAIPLWPAADASALEVVGAMRPVAWVAIAVGLLLIVLHLRARAAHITHGTPDTEREDPSLGLTRPSALAALRNAAGTSAMEPVFVDTIAVNQDPEPEPEHACAPSVPADPFAGTRESAWNPNVLANIDAPRFEHLCVAFYAQAGFSTSSRAHESDGGMDIWLQSRLMPAPRIVRCKHWGGHTVDRKSLRDFLSDMSTHGLDNGTYVTSSSFDADAVEFAKANGVQIQDAQSLLKLIAQRSGEQQAELLRAAYSTAGTPTGTGAGAA